MSPGSDSRPPGLGKPEGSSWYAVWIPRIAVATLVTVLVVYGSRWIFGSTSNFLILLVVAVFVAFALLPAVEMLSRRGWRRGPATAVVMLGGAVLAAIFVLAMTQVVIGQVVALIENAPTYLESISNWLDETFGIEAEFATLTNELTADQDRLTELATNAAGGVLGIASTMVGLIFQGLTIALFVFYILADLPKLRASVLRRFPPAQQLHIDTVTEITIEKVGGYVYSRLLLAVVSAAFHITVFFALGIEYAVALGLWVGLVSQFIPTIGTYLAGSLPLLIALASDPIDAIWVLVAIISYQQVENYFISPRITANTMDLHPAVAFGSVIVGASLLGGAGALLALPAAATAVAIIQTYSYHYEVTSEGPIESPEDYESRIRERSKNKARQGRRDTKRRVKTDKAKKGD